LRGREAVPRYGRSAIWGTGRTDSKRWWAALRDIQEARKIPVTEPVLVQGGQRLSAEEVIREAEKRLGNLYKHPRGSAGWDEEAWQAQLERVERIVAAGRRVTGGVEVPTWEDFRAFVAELPEGKAGWGFLRYEMLKSADEGALRQWYDRVIVPVVAGDWDPARAVKMAELVLIDKGKGDASDLDNFRGIGLLQHVFKVLEWAVMAGMWRKILRVMDEEVLGFLANRSVCQALWKVRAVNDGQRGGKVPWVWLSLDVKKAFDTVIREVGLADAPVRQEPQHFLVHHPQNLPPHPRHHRPLQHLKNVLQETDPPEVVQVAGVPLPLVNQHQLRHLDRPRRIPVPRHHRHDDAVVPLTERAFVRALQHLIPKKPPSRLPLRKLRHERPEVLPGRNLHPTRDAPPGSDDPLHPLQLRLPGLLVPPGRSPRVLVQIPEALLRLPDDLLRRETLTSLH
jgi:hypothetical protein